MGRKGGLVEVVGRDVIFSNFFSCFLLNEV